MTRSETPASVDDSAGHGAGHGSMSPAERAAYKALSDMLMDPEICPPGNRLPRLQDLQKRLNVSAVTLKVALNALEAEGRIQPTTAGGTSDPELAARLTRIIRERIADGTIKPGELFFDSLLQELRVSKVMLRVALAPLIAEGIVVSRPRAGTYVPTAEPDAADQASSAARLGEIVRGRIADGTIKPGQPLSSDLLKEFPSVTRYTLRRALDPLIEQGLLVVGRRVGIYVPLPEAAARGGVRPMPRTTRLTRTVRARIAGGTLSPGQPLTPLLAAEFGVSGTAVRDALAPLVAEGLLESRTGVGIYVPHPRTPNRRDGP